MSELVFKNVCKRYGKGPDVIRDINLTIRQGEFCVFIGPSGCGKSTLLRMVAGLEEISSGELSIAGRLVNDVAPAQRGVAMVFQSYALYPHMTVYQNMAFGLKVMKGLPETIDRKVREAARALQLDGLLERLPKELSGGQRQRVAIGRAIVRQPGVFLFDEPLSNLDAELRVQTRLEIARLHADLGNSTMIYVTHDQVEAMTLADKIVLLNTGEAVRRDGSVAQAGAPLELYHHPVNRFVAGFIGSPKMNFIGAALLKAEAETATLGVAGVPFAARVDARGVDARAGAGRLEIGIRPEHARLLGRPAPRTGQDPGQDSGSADDAPPNTLAGTVAFVEQLGEATLVYVKLADGALFTVREPGGSASRVGERVAIACDPDQLHLFAPDGRACRRTVDPINSTRD